MPSQTVLQQMAYHNGKYLCAITVKPETTWQTKMALERVPAQIEIERKCLSNVTFIEGVSK